MRADFPIVTITSELGAGKRGSSTGVEALKEAAASAGSPLFERQMVPVADRNALLEKAIEYPNAKRIEGVLDNLQSVTKEVRQTMIAHGNALVISGDHSSAAGTIAGIRAAMPGKRLGVIWIDAHADLHTPYTTPSGNIHGMPLCMALSEDNIAHQRNQPKEEVAALWEAMKNLGEPGPKITTEDIVFIGLRDTEPEEEAMIRENHIKVLDMAALNDQTPEQIANVAMRYMAHCEIVYVSFDVDSMDPDTVSRQTGTPVKDGLSAEQAQRILSYLMEQEKVVCLEVTEISPRQAPDEGNKMAETVIGILDNVLSHAGS